MSQHAADGRLRPWPALLARVIGWLVVVVYVAGLCTSYWLERSAGLPNKTPVDEAMLQVGFGAFALVGALLVAKRPTNALGWIMASVAIMVAISPVSRAAWHRDAGHSRPLRARTRSADK